MRRRHLALALVLVLALGPPTAPRHARAGDFWEQVRSPGVRAYRRRVEEGRAALREGRAEDALAAADAAIALRPDAAPAHALRALASIGTGGPGDPRALDAVRRAAAADPAAFDAPDEAEAAARAAALGGEPALGATLLARAVARLEATHPHRARLYVLLGDLRLAAGPGVEAATATDALRTAIRAFREGLSHPATQTRARLGLALALRRAGQLEEARVVAREVLVQGGLVEQVFGADRPLLPPTELTARAAVALEALGDREGARERWRRAAEDGPWQAHALAEADAPAMPTPTRPPRRPARRGTTP